MLRQIPSGLLGDGEMGRDGRTNVLKSAYFHHCFPAECVVTANEPSHDLPLDRAVFGCHASR